MEFAVEEVKELYRNRKFRKFKIIKTEFNNNFKFLFDKDENKFYMIFCPKKKNRRLYSESVLYKIRTIVNDETGEVYFVKLDNEDEGYRPV